MAVKSEILENGLVRHYSTKGKNLLQVETGIVYGEAVDVVPCKYTYKETTELIEREE